MASIFGKGSAAEGKSSEGAPELCAYSRRGVRAAGVLGDGAMHDAAPLHSKVPPVLHAARSVRPPRRPIPGPGGAGGRPWPWHCRAVRELTLRRVASCGCARAALLLEAIDRLASEMKSMQGAPLRAVLCGPAMQTAPPRRAMPHAFVCTARSRARARSHAHIRTRTPQQVSWRRIPWAWAARDTRQGTPMPIPMTRRTVPAAALECFRARARARGSVGKR
jgi:hypothetical protein